MGKFTFFIVRSETGMTAGSSISRSLAEVLTIVQAEKCLSRHPVFQPS